MSVILAAIGFGHMADGTHTMPDPEMVAEQWSGSGYGYKIEDNGDGRKWYRSYGSDLAVTSWTWAGETEIYASFRAYRGVASGPAVISFKDGASHLGAISINTSGYVVYSTYTSPSPTISIVATSTAALPLDSWTHIEVRVIFHGSSGSVKIWINGVLDSDTTGIDTINAGTSCTKVVLFQNNFDPDYKYGDFIIHNDSAPLGDAGVYYLPASADGVDTNFTPSAGDNYQCVDEIGTDEDTTYNESDGTAGHRDSLANAGISGITPISVGALVRARKTAGGAATLLPGIVHSGSETQGAARTLGEDYNTLEEWVDDVPGGAGWTLTQIGNAEVSYEVGA